MAKGPSGRLVVDIDPGLKRELHASLAADGTTFKEWVTARIDQYLDERRQPGLPGMDPGMHPGMHPGMRYSQPEEDNFPMAAEDAATFNPSAPKNSKA